MSESDISSVDFVKLDTEGAELIVLQGGQRLLQNRFRPMILAEVQDIRTEPWGYQARDILTYLSENGFKWFRFVDDSIEALDLRGLHFEGNFLACPEEKIDQLFAMIPTMRESHVGD